MLAFHGIGRVGWRRRKVDKRGMKGAKSKRELPFDAWN
jgi:hypothetical protein